MRYVRFLKTPRVLRDKSSSKAHIYCLIAITSDLGDSFLPYDLELSAELLDAESDEVIVWKTAQWTGGARSLSINLPLSKSRGTSPLRVRIGVEPKSKCDQFSKLLQQDFRGVVSAWSARFYPAEGSKEAMKLVERRFIIGNGEQVHIWEETGESIARHLWDAGVMVSCFMSDILSNSSIGSVGSSRDSDKRFRIVELGTGCGVVGITIAKILSHTDIILTDLAEAQQIAELNKDQNSPSHETSLAFKELDWEGDLHESDYKQVDLVVAADCTYNSDSSPAFVSTICKIARQSPHTTVAVAMKMRHSSEEVFFHLMSEAGFQTSETITHQLPGDDMAGEENIQVYIYRYSSGDDHNST